MSEKERQQIRQAIDLLTSDNGWDDGMRILCKLAGRSTKMMDELRNAPTLDAMKLLRGDNP